MNRGVSDTPMQQPEREQMTTRNEPDFATVYLGHAHNPPRFAPNVLNGFKLS